ncbi:transport-associated protein [Caballeronia temeraria]|uniref:Transport-associated protein n=1 Tax=Caballeronia temeraria TaxID=1777137 RepID=A0A158DK49_9BURK|nr:BON domain-containing protein [Caballeronia temeraria]SAK94157.1 transport-associated protein [Caballeronia temeraria]
MKTMKACVATAIAVSAIVATVPVVYAQQTTATSPTAAPGSSNRAANKALGKRVQTALYKQKGVWSDVHAIARSGKIYLVGMVPDEAQIDLAAKVAEGVPGVTSVQNNLKVEEEGH